MRKISVTVVSGGVTETICPGVKLLFESPNKVIGPAIAEELVRSGHDVKFGALQWYQRPKAAVSSIVVDSSADVEAILCPPQGDQTPDVVIFCCVVPQFRMAETKSSHVDFTQPHAGNAAANLLGGLIGSSSIPNPVMSSVSRDANRDSVRVWFLFPSNNIVSKDKLEEYAKDQAKAIKASFVVACMWSDAENGMIDSVFVGRDVDFFTEHLSGCQQVAERVSLHAVRLALKRRDIAQFKEQAKG